MAEILQNKNSATKFQILIEIANSGPNIQQKSIALRLGITPQAVSDYIQQLAKEDLIIALDRSSFRISAKGVDWTLKRLRDLNEYAKYVSQAITNVTVCAAIAERDIKKGQTAGLKMKGGVLFATSEQNNKARGIAQSSVHQGEDVDIANIEGLIELTRGKVIILQVPNIKIGGSRQVDLKQLESIVHDNIYIGAIGIEALATLRRIGREPNYFYGVIEAAVEASRCGLTFVVVCTDDAISGLLQRLRDENITYEVTDLIIKQTKTSLRF